MQEGRACATMDEYFRRFSGFPMKRPFPAAVWRTFLSVLVIGASPVKAQEQLVDGIAAVVNSNVITYGQVRELMAFRERSLMEMYRGQDLQDKMRESQMAALKDLIDRQLILDEFKGNSFQIPDYVLDDRINSIVRDEFAGDRAAFVRTLQAQGFTLPRFKEVERDKIIVQAMRQKHTPSDFVISPEKIEAFYKANIEQYSTPEQVKLSMIVLREDPGADLDPEASKKAMAQEIRDKLANGADFLRMAQMYSEDSTAETGGDWGWVDRKTLNDELTKVAFALKPGEISRVVPLGDSYYVIRVEAKKAAVTKPLAEVRDEIGKKLLQEEKQKLQDQWLDTLRQKAFIKIF